MSDLDARIRVQLAGWRLNVESLREHGMDLIALDALMRAQAAIVAVLDRHKPVHVDHPLNPNLADCSTCRDIGFDGYNEPAGYPCEEIEDIAKALGIEVRQ